MTKVQKSGTPHLVIQDIRYLNKIKRNKGIVTLEKVLQVKINDQWKDIREENDL